MGKEITGEDVIIDIWYDNSGKWSKMIFLKDGSEIEYVTKDLIFSMNKVCWITGGGSGIGAELAKKLSQKKYIVFISGRTKSNLLKTAKNNRLIIPITGDVSKLRDCQKITKLIYKKYKKIDLVILSAATYYPGSMEILNVSDIKKVVDVNLMGVINCLSTVTNQMKKKKKGAFSNSLISSWLQRVARCWNLWCY